MGKADDAVWATPGVNSTVGHWPVDLVAEVQALSAGFVRNTKPMSQGDQLVQLRRLIDQLEATWLSACAGYDQAGLTADDGASSLAAWLRSRCQLAPGEAAARARVANEITTGSLQTTGDAMRAGQLSWRHAAVIAGIVKDAPADQRVAAEQALQQPARTLDPMLLRRVGAELLHRLDVEKAEERAVRRLERRGLSCSETYDGMVALNGLLDPVSGALVMTALNAKLRPPRKTEHDHGDGHDEVAPQTDAADLDTRSWPQRRADGLADICREWLELGPTPTVAGQRPHVSVIVNHETLQQQAGGNQPGHVPADHSVPTGPAQLSWVGPITPNETQMIACDSVVSRVIMDPAGAVLDVGRATRTIPPAMRTAVIARDRTCIAPGCYRPPEHCDIHHIVFWENGGVTAVHNLAMVCRHHHRDIHLRGWSIEQRSGSYTMVPPPIGRHPPPATA